MRPPTARRRLAGPAVALAVGLAGCAPGSTAPSPTVPTPPSGAGTTVSATPAEDVPVPGSGTWTGTVARVSDGDTLRVVVDDPGPTGLRPGDEVRVRLLRIDTPELGRDGQPAECLAEAAADALASLAPPGTPLVLAPDVEARDRYDRELAHAWTADGTWVNGAMLADGFATAVTFPPNVAYEAEVRARERTAREAGAGLWSTSAC